MKLILHVKPQTMDYIVYGQLDRVPMAIIIQIRIIKFWTRMIQDKDSLMYKLPVKPRSHLAEYFFPIVHDRDKFSNCEQSKSNRNDENAMCDYLSEYVRVCFRLYKDSSPQFLNILRTLTLLSFGL